MTWTRSSSWSKKRPKAGIRRALGVSIFTEADDLETLQAEVRDAGLCHFQDEAHRPRVIRLDLVREAPC